MANSRLLIGLGLIILSLFSVQAVEAVGLGVKPTQLNLNVAVGQKIQTEILVFNVSSEPAMFQVYPDALNKEIKISPTDFQLEANGSQIVKINLALNKAGRFAANLSVVARPLGSQGLPAASGVKVPITIVVSGIPQWLIIFSVILSICLLLFFVVKLKKPKLNNNQPNLSWD